MSLDVDIEVTVGGFVLDAAFTVGAGQVAALVGPNGAGKTTLLRAVAGLQAVTSGRIDLGGTTLDEPRAATSVPVEQRRVGMVFQDHLLLPHIDVLGNVAFGPRVLGLPRREAESTALHWLERTGMETFARARPSSLSGGQAQLVALARALATDPDVLLLDEPLAALDASSRGRFRSALGRHLADFHGPVIVVTHDPLDAFALAEQIVVLEEGHVTQSGTLAEVTARPRTPYVAELLGVNLLSGAGSGRIVDLGDGAVVHVGEPVDGPTLVLVRPRSITLHREEVTGSARNRWRLAVGGMELAGDRARVGLVGGPNLVAEVTTEAIAELGLAEGVEVWAAVKATDVTVYAP